MYKTIISCCGNLSLVLTKENSDKVFCPHCGKEVGNSYTFFENAIDWNILKSEVW
jgi:hypothetical protein